MGNNFNTQNFRNPKGENFQQNRSSHTSTTTEPKLKVPSFDSPELLGKEAEELAREIAQGTDLSITQIRNFYSEVKNIHRLLSTGKSKWEELYGRVKLIKAKVVYNKNRDKNSKRKFEKFEQFISECIDRITNDEKGKRNFEIFTQLFEAVIGYAMAYVKNN